VLVVASIAWLVLKATIGIRVSAEEEHEGLDIGEHGNRAYYGFVSSD
jgi:Amt family ammonium transporter